MLFPNRNLQQILVDKVSCLTILMQGDYQQQHQAQIAMV